MVVGASSFDRGGPSRIGGWPTNPGASAARSRADYRQRDADPRPSFSAAQLSGRRPAVTMLAGIRMPLDGQLPCLTGRRPRKLRAMTRSPLAVRRVKVSALALLALAAPALQ